MIRSTRARAWSFWSVIVLVLVATALLPRIPQDPAYHDFAEDGERLGIPRFWNVVSNLPFLVVGAAVLAGLRRGSSLGRLRVAADPEERPAIALFGQAVLLTAFGSAWYHLAPDHDRLVFDRLPLVLIGTSIVSIAVQERWSVTIGARLLLPGAALGVATVVWWWLSERAGAGDLRAYAAIQVLTVLLVPLLLAFDAPRYGGGRTWLVALAFYVLARLAELYDGAVAALPLAFSGHTWKHLLASLAAAAVARHLMTRRPCSGPADHRAGVANRGQGKASTSFRP